MSGSHQAPPELEPGNGDSVASTPRSDAYQTRVRFMCSFGGKILVRPHDNQLRYAGGDTRIVAVNRQTTFAALLAKLSKLVGNPNISIKYQLPNEDLDALITVTTDEDLENMMEEYDRLTSQKSARLRLFLFPNDLAGSRASSMSSILDGSTKREQWFVDALNGGSVLQRGRSEVSSIVSEVPDYLFGLDTSPRDESKHKIILSDPGSPIASSPYCSLSSLSLPPTTAIPDLPPVITKLDNQNSEITDKTVQQQQPGYPGSPLWHYPAPHVQTIPVYYLPGPVQSPVHSIPMRAPFVHPFPVPPNQLPAGYPPVSSIGQVFRPALAVDPKEFSATTTARVVTEGKNQPTYYGIRNSAGYGGPVVGEEMQVSGTDGKAGRISQ